MKLRSFLDQKRLTNIAVNANVREQWLLDYIKCIGKPLQDVNNNELTFEQVVSDYVNYNGQNKSIKAFIDDQVDPIARRTIIQESVIIGNYVFYGYGDGNWHQETDTNPTSMYGYFDGIWHNEVSRENVYMLGYNDGTWKLEDRISVTLSFLVHNDVYSVLTQQDLDELNEKLKRYVIAPYLFEIRGYETAVTYNGTTDYINTKLFLNKSSIYKGKLKFTTFGTQLFGSQGSYGNYYTMGISDQYTFHMSNGNIMWGSLPTASFDTEYKFENNGESLKVIIDDIIRYSYDVPVYAPANNNECEFFFGAYSIYANPTTFAAYTDYGSSITKDGVTTYFTAHPAGYLFDNFGNIYYNREATYNEFPLNVELTII